MAGLLDELADLLTGPPKKPRPQQPQQQTPTPVPIGSGLAQGVADINTLHPQWKSLAMDAQTNGLDFPDFRSWLVMQGYSPPPNMPRGL